MRSSCETSARNSSFMRSASMWVETAVDRMTDLLADRVKHAQGVLVRLAHVVGQQLKNRHNAVGSRQRHRHHRAHTGLPEHVGVRMRCIADELLGVRIEPGRPLPTPGRPPPRPVAARRRSPPPKARPRPCPKHPGRCGSASHARPRPAARRRRSPSPGSRRPWPACREGPARATRSQPAPRRRRGAWKKRSLRLASSRPLPPRRSGLPARLR